MSKREPLSAGRDYLLECRSYGSRPPATVTWWKNSKFMNKAESQVCMVQLFSIAEDLLYPDLLGIAQWPR